MYGGDGKYHNVSVYWDDYIPLKAENHFFVTETENAQGKELKRNETVYAYLISKGDIKNGKSIR